MTRHRLKRIFQLSVLALLCLAAVTRTCAVRPAYRRTEDAVQWDRASDLIGGSGVVKGPVVDTHYARGAGATFLNLGKPYPEKPRFTIIIWGENRDNFTAPPEIEYLGKTVEVRGIITEYEGLPQVEITSPESIRVVD